MLEINALTNGWKRVHPANGVAYAMQGQ